MAKKSRKSKAAKAALKDIKKNVSKNEVLAQETSDGNSATADPVAREKAKPMAAGDQPAPNSVRTGLLSTACTVLAAAALISVAMIAAALLLPDGKAAIHAIAGMPNGPASASSMKWALLLDTLFPLAYGSGLALLVAGLQSRRNRPLVRIILGTLALAVTADFAENALVYSAMTGLGEPSVFRFSLTVVKYGLLAFGGVLTSAVLLPAGVTGAVVSVVLRYLFPAGIAVIVSGVGGEQVRTLAGLGFPVVLMVLAVYAMKLIPGNRG